MTVAAAFLAIVREALQRAPTDNPRAQFVRYVIVAGAGYLLALSTYAVELALGVPAYPAVAVVFVLNGLWNFYGVRAWAFPATGRTPKSELTRFGAVALLSLAVNYTAFALLFSVLGASATPAQAVAILIAAPVGFLANRLWTFDPWSDHAGHD